MKAKFLFFILSLAPMTAMATIPYRVEQVNMPPPEVPTGYDSEAFARVRRFYAGASYNFSIWNNGNDGTLSVHGQNTSSFDATIGVRPYDIFRIEANYIYANGKWGDFSMTGNTVMLNALFDARIDNIYRLFYHQRMVPYVGIGVGASWNAADGTEIADKVSPAAAAMAGLGVELGERFTIDFGYRYLYIFSPKFSVISVFAPAAHQFRAGIRVNF